MKKTVFILVLAFLMISCSPQAQVGDDGDLGEEEMPGGESPDEGEEISGEQDIPEEGTGMDEVDQMDDDLNFSDLDEIERDLDEFDW